MKNLCVGQNESALQNVNYPPILLIKFVLKAKRVKKMKPPYPENIYMHMYKCIYTHMNEYMYLHIYA